MDAEAVGAISDLIGASAAVVTLAVVATAAVIARSEVREIKRARYAQILVDLLLRWNDTLSEARSAVEKIGSPENLRDAIESTARSGDPRYYELARVLVFFEDLALLERHGIVGREFIIDRFLFTLEEEFHRWKPAIDYLRAERGPAAFEGFERLANAARAEIDRRERSSDGN
jgi:hypothetical protein